MDPAAFPFRCELSLAPLITFRTQLSAYHEFGRGPIPGIVREKAREAPELAGLIALFYIGAMFDYHWNDHSGQIAKIRKANGIPAA